MKHLFASLSVGLGITLAVAQGCGGDAGSGANPAVPGSPTGTGDDTSGGDTPATSPEGGGAPLSAQPEEGEATYYSADGSGNCSYDKGSDMKIAALNTTQYAASAACGSCFKVDGPSGSEIVRIVDRCPGCRANGGIDLSQKAFEAIAPIKAGRVNVTLTPVSCPVSGNLQYRYKEGSSKFWVALQVRDHKLPIKSVEVRKKDGSFALLNRESYNYFTSRDLTKDVDSGVHVRVTAIDGQTVEDDLPTIQAGKVFPGSAQFN